MVAFRTAWPAFAYSIEDDREAKRTYSFVLTYLLTFTSWVALALGALAPWWVRLLTDPRYQRAEKGVALLAFAGAVYAGYIVLAIGSGRARKTQLNWVVTGVGARGERRPQLLARPALRDGRRGDLDRRRVRRALRRHDARTRSASIRCRTSGAGSSRASAPRSALTVAARAAHLPLAPSFLLVLAYPLVLALLGFYLPAERQRLRRLIAVPLRRRRARRHRRRSAPTRRPRRSRAPAPASSRRRSPRRRPASPPGRRSRRESSGTPCSSANRCSRSSRSQRSSGISRPASRPSVASSPRVYFPVSRPLASGKYGSIPIPSRSHAGRISSSISRSTSEYWFCAETNRVSPRSRATRSASSICAAEKFDEPM